VSPAAERRLLRCATYTRKSSEEGLEQDFNSLDAQREACEAFIRSQRSEGWRPVTTRYDDGGYSGGTLERPALTQLLADIEAGKVDTVVVYKVDRLTRSLADFAKIVEILDARRASFVSVTQQFNTTTSMGRLTLNMLLSFAQFEREVTGERIRDKIAASKRKGLWMGGHVPLGYVASGRTLAVVEREAETVRLLFELYLEHGCVRRVMEEAHQRGLRTKVRTSVDPRLRGGRSFGRGHLYHLLRNPVYVGRVPHGKESYPGQHPAIVELAVWEAVQRKMTEQARKPSGRSGSPPSNPLRGKLFDEEGGMLTPSHAVKAGRRYRYYETRRAAVDSSADAEASPSKPGWRLPAREIERVVSEAVSALLANRSEIASAARACGIPQSRIAHLIESASGWTGKPLDLVRRIDLHPEGLTLHVDAAALGINEDASLTHEVPVRMRRRGVEMRLVLEGAAGSANEAHADASLLKVIARAHRWMAQLVSGRVASLSEIARREGVSVRYVGHLMPLAILAPDIVVAITRGTQPADLTAQTLVKQTEVARDWASQRATCGIK